MSDDVLKKVLVAPGRPAGLSKRSPAEDFGWDKEAAKAETAKLITRLAKLQ